MSAGTSVLGFWHSDPKALAPCTAPAQRVRRDIRQSPALFGIASKSFKVCDQRLSFFLESTFGFVTYVIDQDDIRVQFSSHTLFAGMSVVLGYPFAEKRRCHAIVWLAVCVVQVHIHKRCFVLSPSSSGMEAKRPTRHAQSVSHRIIPNPTACHANSSCSICFRLILLTLPAAEPNRQSPAPPRFPKWQGQT